MNFPKIIVSHKLWYFIFWFLFSSKCIFTFPFWPRIYFKVCYLLSEILWIFQVYFSVTLGDGVIDLFEMLLHFSKIFTYFIISWGSQIPWNPFTDLFRCWKIIKQQQKFVQERDILDFYHREKNFHTHHNFLGMPWKYCKLAQLHTSELSVVDIKKVQTYRVHIVYLNQKDYIHWEARSPKLPASFCIWN